MNDMYQRLRGSRAVNWRTVLGLVLVPITAAGVLLWGLWSPTDRLDTVTAAVVNLDEPVELDGQLVPLGRLLAGELIAGDADTNFTWVLTDESDSRQGLDDGRYATVVTIPENFSQAATSFARAAGGEAGAEGGASASASASAGAGGSGATSAQRATIDIETSDRGRLLDAALSNIVVAAATAIINEQLGSQYVGGVFIGMTELGSGITEAADGAQQLAAGSAQLADGAAQLAEGTAGLSSGASSLASGAAGLSGGALSLASGAADLADGASQAAAGGAELAGGMAEYTAAVNTIVDGVIANSAGAVEPLERVRDLLVSIPPELWPPDAETTQEQSIAMVQGLIDEFTAASSGSNESQLVQLSAAGTALSDGAAASAAGQAALAAGLQQYAAGVNEFSNGMGEFSSGAGTFAAGAAQVVPGATQLADGMRASASGSADLADGLSLAAAQVPTYSDDEAQHLAEVAVQPVEAQGASDELFSAAGVPLFAGIALWAGAFASFFLLAPLWRRTTQAARGIGYVTLRSARPALVLGAVQGAIAGVVLPLLLGYGAAQGFSFFALATLAGVSFSLVNQGLSALFGGFGRFVSFVLLAVAFAVGVISTAPPLLQAIGDASPLGSLFDGLQAVAMGASGAGAAAFALVLWGLAGLALTAFAVARARRRAGTA